MLNKLFKAFGNKENEEPSIDLSLGYSRTKEFRDLLEQGNYSKFEDEYEPLSWDAKTLLNEGIGLNPACSPSIKKWVEQRPESYIAQLFAGVSATAIAWIARSAATGANVSEKQANKYFELLEEAANHLRLADEINAEDAEICARTIRVFMGLGVEREKVQGYFDAAIDFEPNHLMAHLMMVNYLNPKWQGSVEEMYDFANTRYSETDNTLLIAIQLFAITEEWVYYDISGEEEAANSFFKNEELKSTLKEMYQHYEESEEGALLIPYVYNYFAFLFHQFGEKQLAKECIIKLDNRMTLYPWAYIGIENVKSLLAKVG